MRPKVSMISSLKTLLLVTFVLGVLAFAGCTGTTVIPKGWSGGTIADGTLFIGSMEGKVVAMNITDGSRTWTTTLEAAAPSGQFGCAPAATTVAIYGSPAVAEGLVYVGGYDGKIYAFSPGRDESRWIYPRQGNLGGAIVGGLTIAQDKVYFGCADGKVYALNAADGFKEWEFTTG
ncbi:MAG: PQQ-binding-like beta-propeller repeat protein, partial [Chloroflexota bacterium]